MKDLQPGKKLLTLSTNSPAYLLLSGEMDLPQLVKITAKTRVLKALLATAELMALLLPKGVRGMENGLKDVERTSLMVAKLEKVSCFSSLLTMESPAEDIVLTFRMPRLK